MTGTVARVVRSRGAGVAMAMLAGVSLGACTPVPDRTAWHGRSPIGATYRSQVLTSELPHTVPVPSVAAAAEGALARRGYTVTANQRTTDQARVVARPSDERLHRRVTVTSRVMPRSTRVTVRVEPGGDETISREILEGMLSLMGL